MTSTESPARPPGSPPSGARGRRPRGAYGLALALALALVAATALVVVALRARDQPSTPSIRAAGVPSDISTRLANLMGLDPVPAHQAPGFVLTDQHGQTLSLSSFRGHPVVLEFMDPHCTDICPIVSQEFIDAYHNLAGSHPSVVFLAVNVNPYHLSVADVAAFSEEHQLASIPTWHFFTGPLATLRTIWARYGIEVQARGPNADVIHSSIVFFIASNGKERFVAAPTDDHTKAGVAYLPAGQLSAWGRGIALVAADIRR